MSTELERLRVENQQWRTDARKREVREAEQAALLREAQAKAATKRQADERAKRLAEEVEECRRGAWLNHRLSEAAARGDVESLATTATEIIATFPSDGSWPPGQSASDYFTNLAPTSVEPADDLSELPMIQAARKLGVKI